MSRANFDDNAGRTLIITSHVDSSTPINPEGDPTTLEQFANSKKLAVQVAVDSGDSNITYVGEALAGGLTSASVWRIQSIDETTGTVVTWADGDTLFDNEWDERENLSYS